jgi:CheY-like chemotaxis protein
VSRAHGSGRGTPAGGARLLIVDDEPAIVIAMSEYLAAVGHQVDVARDRARAEALLAGGRHDLVIADLRLSAGDALEGMRVVQRAAALRPRPRILVLTAYGSPALEDELAAAGVDLVLSKPQPLAVVAKVVEVLLAAAPSDSWTDGVRNPESGGGQGGAGDA